MKVNFTPEFVNMYKQMQPYKLIQISNGHVRKSLYKSTNLDTEVALTSGSQVKFLKETKKECVSILSKNVVKINTITDIQPNQFIGNFLPHLSCKKSLRIFFYHRHSRVCYKPRSMY
jgi:hypothetical protein